MARACGARRAFSRSRKRSRLDGSERARLSDCGNVEPGETVRSREERGERSRQGLTGMGSVERRAAKRFSAHRRGTFQGLANDAPSPRGERRPAFCEERRSREGRTRKSGEPCHRVSGKGQKAPPREQFKSGMPGVRPWGVSTSRAGALARLSACRRQGRLFRALMGPPARPRRPTTSIATTPFLKPMKEFESGVARRSMRRSAHGRRTSSSAQRART